jgi:hypothetical protein
MALDYGFFDALTPMMEKANVIQQNRDARKLQEFQLQQKQRQIELAQLDKVANQQKMLNASIESIKRARFSR